LLATSPLLRLLLLLLRLFLCSDRISGHLPLMSLLSLLSLLLLLLLLSLSLIWLLLPSDVRSAAVAAAAAGSAADLAVWNNPS
jgi:hypothetical protein